MLALTTTSSSANDKGVSMTISSLIVRPATYMSDSVEEEFHKKSATTSVIGIHKEVFGEGNSGKGC